MNFSDISLHQAYDNIPIDNGTPHKSPLDRLLNLEKENIKNKKAKLKLANDLFETHLKSNNIPSSISYDELAAIDGLAVAAWIPYSEVINQDDLIKIARLAMQQNPLVALEFHRFGIQDELIRLGIFCDFKQHTLPFIKKFHLTENARLALAEWFAFNERTFSLYVENFEISSEEFRLSLAHKTMISYPAELFRNIQFYKISKESDRLELATKLIDFLPKYFEFDLFLSSFDISKERDRFDLAMKAAERGLIGEWIDELNIQTPQFLYALVYRATKTAPHLVARGFAKLKIDDKHSRFHIAQSIAKMPEGRISAYIDYFRIQDQRSLIAICIDSAIFDLENTLRHLSKYGFGLKTNEIREMICKISAAYPSVLSLQERGAFPFVFKMNDIKKDLEILDQYKATPPEIKKRKFNDRAASATAILAKARGILNLNAPAEEKAALALKETKDMISILSVLGDEDFLFELSKQQKDCLGQYDMNRFIVNFALDKIRFSPPDNWAGGDPRLSGIFFAKALHRVIQEMESSPLDLKQAKSILRSCIAEIQRQKYCLCSHTLIEAIQTLQFGKSLLIPTGTTKHSVLIRIEKSGHTEFKVLLYNTGDGLNQHYMMMRRLQTFMVYDSVPIENILNRKNWENFLDKIPENISLVYAHFRNLCIGGKRRVASPHLEYYESAQKSGSCAYQIYMAMLRERLIHIYNDPVEGLGLYKIVKGMLMRSFAEMNTAQPDPLIKLLFDQKLKVFAAEQALLKALLTRRKKRRIWKAVQTENLTELPLLTQFAHARGAIKAQFKATGNKTVDRVIKARNARIATKNPL